MKRLLSLLLALAMVISMVPSVFAEETESGATVDGGVSGGTDVGLWGVEEITDQDFYITVALEAGDSDGCTYLWTAQNDGSISVYGSCEDEAATFDVILTKGETVVAQSESEDGTAVLDVVAGDEVFIQVVALPDAEGNYGAAEIGLSGTFTYPAGTEQNPIWPEFVWNEAYTAADATVVAPVGTTYYAVYGDGMLLTINGGEATTLVSAGMRMPCVFSITNDGEAEAEYALHIEYPVGHQQNPAELVIGWNDVSLPENSQGYYYTWIAEDTGILTAYISSITEGVEADIIINNNTTYANKTLQADGVDNYGLEVSMDVNKGDEISIQIAVLPDANWAYPAADITWVSSFAYPAGSEQNPIMPEFVWNEAGTEADATVVAPVGTTYYSVYGAGMLLTINGGEAIELNAANPRMPAVFSITNEGEAEAEYVLHISYPVGNYMNPEALVIGWNDVSLPENSQGYYYTWTAEGTGTLTAYISAITEGVSADIVINNNTTYANKSLQADGVDNNGLEVTMDVNEGDVISIQVVVMPDENYAYPAADITWVSSFAYPAGSEQNPIYPEFTWNEANTEATATVVAPVGTTYYAVYGAGMKLSINDGEATTLVASGIGRAPAIFTITNDGEAEAEYSLKIWYPVGNQSNPDALVIGENSAVIEAGSQGYYYNWTAEADGTLSITMPEGNWSYVINNMTTYVYGDTQWSDSDPVVNPGTIEVAAGDVVEIIVNTYDPADSWNTPAGTLVFTAAFEEPEPEVTIEITQQPVDSNSIVGKTATFTVEVNNEEGVTYQWYICEDGTTWKKCSYSSAKSKTLSFTANATRIGWQVYCQITDANGNTINSDIATVTEKVAQITISVQPSDKEVVLNKGVQIVTRATSSIGDITYEWEEYRESTGKWNSLKDLSNGSGAGTLASGSNRIGLTLVMVSARDGAKVRCKLTDADGAYVYTNEATLTRIPNPMSVAAQPGDVVCALNVPVEFHFEVTGYTTSVKYKWYFSNNGGVNWGASTQSGYNTDTLKINAYNSRNGYMYKCIATDAAGHKFESEPATLTVLQSPITILTKPENQTVAIGETAQFYVEFADYVGSEEELTYQWYFRKSSTGTWGETAADGCNSDTLKIVATANNNGYQYYCKVTDSFGHVKKTAAVTLTVEE